MIIFVPAKSGTVFFNHRFFPYYNSLKIATYNRWESNTILFNSSSFLIFLISKPGTLNSESGLFRSKMYGQLNITHWYSEYFSLFTDSRFDKEEIIFHDPNIPSLVLGSTARAFKISRSLINSFKHLGKKSLCCWHKKINILKKDGT